MIGLLNRLFKREEINGANRCPTYLYRWHVFACRWFGVYLHRFVGEDWSRDMHDHPKRFVSIGLAGGYVEHTPSSRRLWYYQAGSDKSQKAAEETAKAKCQREYRAPWIRSFPAKHIHRITLGPHKECWTLVIVFAAVRPWGFWHLGRWIHWREYVKGNMSHIADQMAACGGEE